MEKLTLLVLCSSFYSIRASGCNADLPPCGDVHDVATITCNGGEPCTIACGEDDCSADISGLIVQDGNTIEQIDVGICKDKCREQSKLPDVDPVCQYYRWEEKGVGSKCILQTVCVADVTCQADEPHHKCMSGEIGCSEDGTVSCSLASKVEYHHENFHLICHGDSSDINIYTDDAIKEIPAGTVCSTIHKCDAWIGITEEKEPFFRKLAIFCADDGTWQSTDKQTPPVQTGDNTMSQAMIVNDNTLVEPQCESVCGDLITLPANLDQEGTELICDEPLDGNALHDGNSCVLICDNHFAMSISCEFNYDGTKNWMDQDRNVITDETLIC